jgi:hypothetical protein
VKARAQSSAHVQGRQEVMSNPLSQVEYQFGTWQISQKHQFCKILLSVLHTRVLGMDCYC